MRITVTSRDIFKGFVHNVKRFTVISENFSQILSNVIFFLYNTNDLFSRCRLSSLFLQLSRVIAFMLITRGRYAQDSTRASRMRQVVLSSSLLVRS